VLVAQVQPIKDLLVVRVLVICFLTLLVAAVAVLRRLVVTAQMQVVAALVVQVYQFQW
jgi:hypothetical protein